MSFLDLKSTVHNDQHHLFEFWDQISEEEKELLAKDIKRLKISQSVFNFQRAMMAHRNKKKILDDNVKPVPIDVIESVQNLSAEKMEYYRNIGLREIAEGHVGIILLAGGQGTRLGVDFPKGMYNINLPSGRTLFHLQALRIRCLQKLAKEQFSECKDITWYIMTSDATHKSTIKYFEENLYFGLNQSQIVTFKQGTLPCFTMDGKIILDEKHRISKAPDGNGGLYTAIKNEGILNDMKDRGINCVHVFSVDNVLVKVGDPVFLGYCTSRSADCGVKVVTKRSADEPVGVVCKVNGLYTVVEYSEIPPSTAQRLDNKGNLIFNSGNICNHFFTTAFLQNVVDKYESFLDLHIAKKKIPFINKNGLKCIPDKENGVKIEKFIFDVFKYAENFVMWKVVREDEFSALKNADLAGIDCPSTARSDILQLHKKWLLNAGAHEVEGDVEICPLLSYEGENLQIRVKDKSLKGPLCLM